MILLKKDDRFAKGSQRDCYYHPDDDSKIIKIIYSEGTKKLNQNELEYQYYSVLKNSVNMSYSNIAKCYGFVETNLGKGLVFERIVDYDNKNSKQLTYYLKNKKLSDDILEKLLNELYSYLLKNNVLFLDVATLNVLCKKESSTTYKLIIIDGLGPKDDNIKFILYKYFPLYKKYKILKQWKKFMNLVKKVKES